jgi:nucleoside-triphosphatase THEP1
LVTGQPGSGKTTAVKAMIELLDSDRCQVFYTDEVLNSIGERIGFDIVPVPNNRREILARTSKEDITRARTSSLPDIRKTNFQKRGNTLLINTEPGNG